MRWIACVLGLALFATGTASADDRVFPLVPAEPSAFERDFLRTVFPMTREIWNEHQTSAIDFAFPLPAEPEEQAPWDGFLIAWQFPQTAKVLAELEREDRWEKEPMIFGGLAFMR